MANAIQKAILVAKISGVLKDLMVKTTADQVYIDESTTLANKLADVITALNGKAPSTHSHAQSDISGLSTALNERPTITAMNTAIADAISELVNGAPGTADTLKELSDLIGSNDDAIGLLNSAVGNKADKSTVTTLQNTVSAIQDTVAGLGSLATKSSVSYNDLDTSLKNKIDTVTSGNHSHSNKGVLDNISSTTVANWNAKTRIHYSATEPNMADGDIWMKLIN